MAIELMDEHEQGELVRSWLRQNAVAILVGILAGIAMIFGWQQWKASKVAERDEAQAQYRAYVAAVDKPDAAEADKLAAELRTGHGSTPYAVFAAFRQAQEALEKSDLKTAADALAWAHANAELPELRDLAALRLARVRIASEDAAAALKLVDGIESKGFDAIAQDIRGDAYVALDRATEARNAYEAALAALDATSPQRAFIEMKRDDLPATTAPAAPAAAAPAADKGASGS